MKRRTLTGAERADWLRLSRTRGIGPITFFHLLERHGSAAAVLEDLPALAKKAGGRTEIKAPDLSEIQREIEVTARLGAAHLAACEPDYSNCLAAIDAPPPVIAIRGNRTLLNRPSIAMVLSSTAWCEVMAGLKCAASKAFGSCARMIWPRPDSWL